jgi:hypothetical protein
MAALCPGKDPHQELNPNHLIIQPMASHHTNLAVLALGEMRSADKIFIGKPEGIGHIGYLSLDGRIISK